METTDFSSSSSGSSDSPEGINKWSMSQPNTSQVPISIPSSIEDLLSTRLSPGQLQANYQKLDLLKKSSFYIVLVRHDGRQPDNEHYISNSTILQHIDIPKFNCVKVDGRSQVKLKLELLEMLHDELFRGQQELENILAEAGGTSLELREVELREKVFRLHQVAEEFDAVMIPGRLSIKHSLLRELERKRLPRFHLVLEAEQPLLFNREETQAFCDSVVLHWYIPEQEQHDPGVKFEVSYKILNPTDMAEARQFGWMSCSGYNINLNNLVPERSYQFSVKRLETFGLVYEVWNDTIVLTTTSQHTGM
ncbi:hypothetical protein KOW79_017265 [Hemibagrus wyckioides]|uniref:Fibronectin type-III domain-containing protein n=1 Tax=Hemibagrus wyckioides TaxID=337641 RepID=A0A9D3N8P6_9TELE|nr:hypothetical protein KOW79_017265 [Hemibagrus wyckioides]